MTWETSRDIRKREKVFQYQTSSGSSENTRSHLVPFISDEALTKDFNSNIRHHPSSNTDRERKEIADISAIFSFV